MSHHVHPAAHVRVRYEEQGDIEAIRRVNEAAFARAAEATVVDATRAAGGVVLSMVAVVGADEVGGDAVTTGETAEVPTWGGEGNGWGEPGEGTGSGGCSAPGAGRVVGGEVVGHVLITEAKVTTDQGDVALLGLGPLAVLPEQQGQGVGTMLVAACLERLRESGYPGVVLLGHPTYYPRFGFIRASRWGLRWEGDAPDEAFMALELLPGQLSPIRGVVRFRPEFDLAIP